MTRVNIETYDDLDSCREISGKGADVVAELLNEGIETVVYIPGWMDDHCLEPIAGGKTLFVGTVEDYSEKSWKVTQTGGAFDYVAKSQAVVFQSATDTIDSPQQGLGAFATGDSR